MKTYNTTLLSLNILFWNFEANVPLRWKKEIKTKLKREFKKKSNVLIDRYNPKLKMKLKGKIVNKKS